MGGKLAKIRLFYLFIFVVDVLGVFLSSFDFNVLHLDSVPSLLSPEIISNAN